MKKIKVALYNPYLDVLGGGEKHILSILQVIQNEGYEVCIFWDEDLQKQFKQKLNIRFEDSITFLPNIFLDNKNVMEKINMLKDFDIFLYVTNGSYFFSSAKKNFIFAMVPEKKLYGKSLINRLKTANHEFISNSYYTQKWLKEWGISSKVIYPYVDEELIHLGTKALKKEKIILSVGRFFEHLHSKRQDVMIDTFIKLKKSIPTLNQFKLLLVGNVKEEDQQYFEKIRVLAQKDKNIILKTNIDHQELINLYKKSLIYWHFAGYNVDEQIHPSAVEHLGISPLEAMAAQCIVFAYRAGGLKETITDQENGFLFSSTGELQTKMSLILNKKHTRSILDAGNLYVNKHFSYEVFCKRVKEIILEI